MGNASAKEGENGHMAASPEPAAPNGGGGSSSSAGGAAARPPPLSPPDDVMLERPPPVPYLFVPQVPETPLHRPTELSPLLNHSPVNESTDHHSQEQGIPTLITWSQGGDEVFLEGSWDNWTSRRALERSGKDHAVLLVLPSGVYHYRIIVDGELRYIPELPHAADERGRVANVLDVHVRLRARKPRQRSRVRSAPVSRAQLRPALPGRRGVRQGAAHAPAPASRVRPRGGRR
ncbi:SNF1-related protein kinase regulatory subunit beta-1 [Zea mays]|uniref:SNF1-related protein kinase regulatory subunit beta-1 n=1 Tax=Zea mays TaxID=4577 RepID=A0A1D6FSM5_MAIZE|nr:SNF1-related protein kinase regulatory subunit beta-1 [Zea mays]